MYDEEARANLKKLNKKTVTMFAVLGLAVFLLLLIPVFLPKETVQYDDDGEMEDGMEESAYMTFENEYQLDYSIGKITAERILARIGRFITDKTGSVGEIIGTIVETSLRKDSVDSGYGYSFEMDVSNGEKYQIWVRTGGLYGYAYDCSLIERLSPESDTGNLDIVLERVGTEDLNRGQAVVDLSAWAKERLPGVNIVVNVTDL